jgi:hypothetical protein
MSEAHCDSTQLSSWTCASPSATNDSLRDVRAADLQEEVVKPLFAVAMPLGYGGVSPDPTKTAATNEHRSERREQSNTAPVRERNTNPKWVKLRSSMS